MTRIMGTTDGKKALSGYIGKMFTKKANKIKYSENIYLDLNSPHMITIAGKRGYGKSYTMAVIAEELMKLPSEAKENLTGIIIDSMGIYWSIQEKNKSSSLSKWNLEPKDFPVTIYYPHGLKERYEEFGQYFHKGFELYPSELTISDWLFILDIKETQAQATILNQIIEDARNEYGDFYSLDDLLDNLNKIEVSENVKTALERRLEKAKSWGIFSDNGMKIDELLNKDSFIVLDLSGAGELPWNVRTTLTGLLVRKILSKRTFARNKEEINKFNDRKISASFPLVWLFIDEAHLFAPASGKTPSTEPLKEWVKQGRRPGLSIVLATQQPGSLDNMVLSQCDILFIHRITAGQDAKAIESKISEIHESKTISEYMKDLPKEPGYALVMSDKTEEILPIKVRHRQSRHAGESAKLEEYMHTE